MRNELTNKLAAVIRRHRTHDSFYRPLGQDEIRVLVLDPLPVPSGELLTCQIQHITLNRINQLPYEAISYVWGDPTPCVPILANGHRILLPENGEKALRRMAFPSASRVLWLDSVCINQVELEERAQQVSIMGSVFRGASSVLVYLGDSDEYTKRALTNIQLLQREIEADIGLDIDITLDFYQDQHPTFRTLVRSPIDDEALRAFYSRSWFKRAWVVQEFAVARKSLAVCGDNVCDMHLLLRVAYWLKVWHVSYISAALNTCLSDVYRFWVVSVDVARKDGITVEELLRVGKVRDAWDPRDKIFGMVGLLDQDQRHNSLLPHYKTAVEDVFRNAVRRALITSKVPLRVLNYVSHRDNADLKGSRYPTWTPRFDRQHSSTHDSGLLPFHGDSQCAGTASVARQSSAVFTNPDVLTLRGIILTRVTEVFMLRRDNQDSDIAKLVRNKADGLNPSVSKSVFARTLIADTSATYGRSTKSEQSSFEDWYMHVKEGLAIPLRRHVTADLAATTKRAAGYRSAMLKSSINRSLAFTDNGAVGLVPWLCQVGDVVVIVHGGRSPFVLRPHKNGYLLLGASYIDGYMRWQERAEEIEQRLSDGPNQNFDIR